MSSAYRRLKSAEMMELDGDTLILNGDTFAVAKLNEIGGRIWRLLEERATADLVAERISLEYEGAGRERIRDDAARFLRELEAIGLVQDA